MVEIKMYKPEHFWQIQEQNGLVEFFKTTFGEKVAEKDTGITIYHDGEILCAMGVNPLWQGTAEAWLLVNPLALKHPKILLKLSREWIQRIMYSMHLLRLQADVNESYPAQENFARHAGFQKEGTMRKYHGGENYGRYAFIREVKKWHPAA